MKKFLLLVVLVLGVFALTACGTRSKTIPVNIVYFAKSDISQIAGRDIPMPYTEDTVFEEAIIKHEYSFTSYSVNFLNLTDNPNVLLPNDVDEFFLVHPDLFDIVWKIAYIVEYKDPSQECRIDYTSDYSEDAHNITMFEDLIFYNGTNLNGRYFDTYHKCFDNIKGIVYFVDAEPAYCKADDGNFKCDTENLQVTKIGNILTFTIFDQVTQEDVSMIKEALAFKNINPNILPLEIEPNIFYTIDISKP